MENQTAAVTEVTRLGELYRLAILDTEADQEFDLIARAAANVFDAPIALVSLIDNDRQWFKAVHGMVARQTPRAFSFCSHAIQAPDDVMLVCDATLDDRFRHNPFVTNDPHIRFYAGVPLVTRNGYAIGTLCVLDRRVRTARPEQLATLKILAALTMRLIEHHVERSEISAINNRTARGSVVDVAVFGWDANGRITSWSEAAQTLLGWTARDVLGHFPPMVLDDERNAYVADCARTLLEAAGVIRLGKFRAKDGGMLSVTITSTPVRNFDGHVSGISTVEKFGARIATESRLAMLESVIVNSTDAVSVSKLTPGSDGPPSVLYINTAFTQMTGYSAAEILGKSVFTLWGPNADSQAAHHDIQASLAQRENVSTEVLQYRKDGSEFYAELSISQIMNPDGSPMYYVSIRRDITERRALEEYERNRSAVLEMAVRDAPLHTQLLRIAMIMKSVIRGTMGTIMLLDGKTLHLGAADPDMPAGYLAAIEGVEIGPDVGSCGTAAFLGEAAICGDIDTDYRWRNYREFALGAGLQACWSIPLFGANGDVLGAFALYADRPMLPAPHQLRIFEETVRFASIVVDRHRDRARLERMALYDSLTELPNRKLFEERLHVAIDHAAERGRYVAVGVMDINRFKSINDAFGHHVGDGLLRSIADRLSHTLRDGETIARMAGDEFFVLLTDLACREDSIEAATRLLQPFSEVFHAGGHEIFVRASFGLALFPDHAQQTEGLLQAADRAMYAAKIRGGGFAIAENPVVGAASEILELENDLRYALERGELELHYQMMFASAGGRPVGAEALIRWNHPRRGLIAPGDFIPLAEANGTIVPIGKWVIDNAARTARRWQDEGHDAFVAVNVSALQFDEPGLVATVVTALERSGLEPHRLHLELTESLVMRNPATTAATLLQLKALGVRIVIDDFGTGYSSLAYLESFAVDALKIDRAFVGGIGEDDTQTRSASIIRAVVNLGQALGVTTIAEGVEHPTQLKFVQSCGCDIVQGFLTARPVALADLQWAPLVGTGTVSEVPRP